MNSPVLALKNIHKSYAQGGAKLEILRGISLTIEPGETVALLGPSGCGKSTLLQICGLLDQPDSGEVIMMGQDCTTASDAERTRLRREYLGFVYQFHHLLPEFSALENVMLPQLVAGAKKSEAREKAKELLGSFGLEQRFDHRPPQLSGGEQQRVAIARALANAPSLLLADEPTGNLDPQTAGFVFDMLLAQAKTRQLATLIVTHNHDLAAKAHRVIRLGE